MLNQMEIAQPLSRVLQTVNQLDEISKQLVDVMDNQIKAIINADIDKIEELTDSHTTILTNFKKNEQVFITELKQIISSAVSNDKDIHLSTLKKMFPDSAGLIDEWKSLLVDNTKRLQEKNFQVLMLLEFAMKRNEKKISGIYDLYNRKNAHYSSEGSKKGVTAGMKINQEV